jgi:ferritin
MDGVTIETMGIFKLDFIQEQLHEERMATEISDMFRLMGDDDDYGEGLDGDEMFI